MLSDFAGVIQKGTRDESLLAAVAWILRRLARAPVDVQAGPRGVAPLLADATREHEHER